MRKSPCRSSVCPPEIYERLLPGLKHLHGALDAKAQEFDKIIKASAAFLVWLHSLCCRATSSAFCGCNDFAAGPRHRLLLGCVHPQVTGRCA